MAGVFESIGRTNTLSAETGKLSDMVLGLRKMDMQEKQQGMEAELNASNLETNRLQQNSLKNQLAEYERTQKQRGQVIDVTAHPWYQSATEGGRAAALKALKGAGAIDDRNTGKWGDIQDAISQMSSTAEGWKGFTLPEIEGKKHLWEQAVTELRDMESSAAEKGQDLSKDKKYLVLQAQEKKLRDLYQISNGSYVEHLNKLEQTEAATKAALAKEAGKKFAPSSDEKKYNFYKDKFPDVPDNLLAETLLNKGQVNQGKAVDAYNNALEMGYSEDKAKAIGQQALDFINEVNKGSQIFSPSKKEEMPEMPDPGKLKGRVIKDKTTGKRYRSDGSKWNDIK